MLLNYLEKNINMRTLIIHPKDSTTSFLDIIYKPITNKTVISDGISKFDLLKEIDEHDRVMMMGHGSPHGLFSLGLFKDAAGYIIDNTFVSVLEKKNNSVFIWCNADKFVEKYNLKGMYSGMFISEVSEAYFCGLQGVGQDLVNESNDTFGRILSESINEPQEVAYNNLVNDYGILSQRNSVALYNNKRLYLTK
jgi:hypothetical protein